MTLQSDPHILSPDWAKRYHELIEARRRERRIQRANEEAAKRALKGANAAMLIMSGKIK